MKVPKGISLFRRQGLIGTNTYTQTLDRCRLASNATRAQGSCHLAFHDASVDLGAVHHPWASDSLSMMFVSWARQAIGELVAGDDTRVDWYVVIIFVLLLRFQRR